MTWTDGIADYLTYLAAIGRPHTTVELRRYQLTYLGRSTNQQPAAVTGDDLIDWFARHDWQPETRRSYRSAVRGFYGWAVDAGRLAQDPAERLPQVAVPRGVAKPAPEIVYRQALAAAGSRTRLMLRLAGEAGLRRAEIAQVHARDVRYMGDGAWLLVRGKGARERVVPITEDVAAALTAGSGWVFPSVRGGHVSPAWVGTLCSEVLPGDWTLHKLRHLFASKAYRGTRNLRAVQELLGHSSVSTTERYTAVDDGERRAAMMAAAG